MFDEDRKTNLIVHPFAPVFNHESRILILGTLPSRQSRGNGFYYGHPQNRFWPLLARLMQAAVPENNDEKRALLLQHGIALWDVIASCTITGSSDASIRDVVPNNLGLVLDMAPIRRIYCNGTRSFDLYNRYCREQSGRDAVQLPSTSPANAGYGFERLVSGWTQICDSMKSTI